MSAPLDLSLSTSAGLCGLDAAAEFRRFVLSESFPCLGGRSAIRRGAYRLGVYSSLGAPDATDALHRDLSAFVAERGDDGAAASATFVAIFADRRRLDEAAFERRLWAQLQALHERDRGAAQRWDPTVSSDPADPRFAFSVAGRAHFVIGLHPASSRLGRRFAWPTLIFNAHDQFERLRRAGLFGRMRDRIRARDLALNGTPNPNLADYGECSEARQYSGRAVDATWRCPFRAAPEAAAGCDDDARA